MLLATLWVLSSLPFPGMLLLLGPVLSVAVLPHAAISVLSSPSSVPIVTAAAVCCLRSQMLFMCRMAKGVRKLWRFQRLD